MPRNLVLCAVVVLGGGCWFDADYRGGHYTCGDGVCPAGLTCSTTHVCVAPASGDAGVADAATDAPAAIDARVAAATCADPMPLPIGATLSGSTAGRGNTITASCAGFVMNGDDAVYLVAAAAGDHLLVSLTGALSAYAIAPCAPSPATPVCLGNTLATAGNPLGLIAAGPTFIIVDSANPATTGPYALTVTH